MFNSARRCRPIGSRTCRMQLSFRGSCDKYVILTEYKGNTGEYLPERRSREGRYSARYCPCTRSILHLSYAYVRTDTPPPHTLHAPHSKRNKRSVSHHASFQLLLLDDGDVKVILNFTLVEGAFHHGRFLETLQL